MAIKMDDVLIYKDSKNHTGYGTGVVTSITSDEYTILWSGHGSTRYKRSILDGKLEQVFQRVDKTAGLPKERHLQLGASKSKTGVPFNENYDREKLALLCDKLRSSGGRKAIDVADGLRAELFTKKLVLRGAAKTILCQLAELCDARSSYSDEAREISKELFFGYVLSKSDFHERERGK
ncbi:MAG TPA: hypothetical protein VIG62_21515 [Blastocatellia bacterium]|jgi:hypothetical protein